MKKIPTLYEREFNNHIARVIGEHPISNLEWVEEGEGIATVKIDGACCAIINGIFYKRYDAKNGKPISEDAIPCQEKADEITGHFPCWKLCHRDLPEDKHFWEAYDNANGSTLPDGTYEAIGPSWATNPYKLDNNTLVRHGSEIINDLSGRDINTIRKYLETHLIEGIVFWKDNEPQCKIKRSDFGFEWNPKPKKR